MLNRKCRYRSKNSQFKRKSFRKTPYKKTERGYSLLELTTVIFPLLLLVVGAIDITRVVQSYRALSEGVETALRCAYPVNGECQQVSADAAPAQFNWYRFANVPTVWGDSFFYGSYVNTLQQPQYEINSFTAEILGSVTYEIPAYRHSAELNFYKAVPVLAPTVIMKAARPTATVNSSTDIVFHYANYDPNNTSARRSARYGTSYTFTPTGRGSGLHFERNVNLSINGETEDSGHTFITVPRPRNIEPDGDCFLSDKLDESHLNRDHNPGAPCPGRYAEVGDVVVWIKGTTSGTSTGSTGVVDVQYRRNGNLDDLGGREFTGSGVGNFVGRGSGDEHTRQSEYEESGKYETVRVRYGERTRINFDLRRSDDPTKSREGDAKWRLTEIVVFPPEFIVRGKREIEDIEARGVECGGGLLLSADPSNPDLCKVEVEKATVKSWKFTNSPPERERSVNVDESLGLTATDSLDFNPCTKLVTSKKSQSLDACSQDYTFTSTYDPLKSQHQSCDPDTIPSVPYGTQAEIRAAIESGKICEIKRTTENGEYLDVSKPKILDWQFTTETVKLDNPLRWAPQNCSTPDPTISSGIQGYDRIIDMGERKALTVIPQAILVTEEDPEEFRKANDYECDAFENSDPILFNKYTKSDEPDSFFAKAQADRGSDYEEEIRDITYAEGMDSKAYVHVDERIKDKPMQLPGIPSDSSISYWFSDTQDLGAKTIVAGSPYPKGTVPEVCKDPASFCRAELESLPLRDEADFEVLTEQAELLGYQEMQLAYPSARPGCDEPGCVSLELSAPDTNNMINAEATMKVPLATLFGNDIEISFTDSERWEGHFAKNAD